MSWAWEPDLVEHVIDANATGKQLQVLLADIAVPRYHGTAIFSTLKGTNGSD